MATPVPSLRDRKKDATRQVIEDVAWDLFTTQGFDATTVQQIAERANVAPRTFFRYFPTKEAVLYPEIDGLLEHMATAFEARPADEPALVSLVAALDSVSAELSANRSRQFERFHLMKKSGAGASSTFVNERIAAAVADMVRRRYADKPDAELRAQLAAGVLTTVMSIGTQEWLNNDGQGQMEDEARHCFDLVRGLLTN